MAALAAAQSMDLKGGCAAKCVYVCVCVCVCRYTAGMRAWGLRDCGWSLKTGLRNRSAQVHQEAALSQDKERNIL